MHGMRKFQDYLFAILFSRELLYYSFGNLNPVFGVLSL